MTAYRTLFTGLLRQESALNVGGTRSDGFVDQVLCRDGAGRLTLRGDTLSGALVATARRLYPDLPGCITGKQRSVWRPFTSHPLDPTVMPELRQGVGLLQETGAAASGVLYDLETLPRGVCWPIVLEVDVFTAGTEGERAERMALGVLREWRQGRCWLGASVARGLGWCRLTDLRAYRLTLDEHGLKWPDSEVEDPYTYLSLGRLGEPLTEQDGVTSIGIQPTQCPWHYLKIQGTLQVGERECQSEQAGYYGLDALNLGGHLGNSLRSLWDENHVSRPLGAKPTTYQTELFAPDLGLGLAMTYNLCTKSWEPFIPGSGLRGPLRHELSRSLRREGKAIRDPNAPGRYQAGEDIDAVESLFGTTSETLKNTPEKVQSARLLVRDAYLRSKDWLAAQIHHHRGDELNGGVFEANKFSRLTLLRGVLDWTMVIEAPSRSELDEYWRWLKPLLARGEAGRLGIGAGKWRGSGWPRWKIGTIEYGQAGAEWVLCHTLEGADR